MDLTYSDHSRRASLTVDVIPAWQTRNKWIRLPLRLGLTAPAGALRYLNFIP